MEGCSHSQGPHRCGNRQSTGSVEEELLHCFPWNRGLRAGVETRQEAGGTRPAAAYQNHLLPREVQWGLLVWQTVGFRLDLLPCGAYVGLSLLELARNGLFPGEQTMEPRVVMETHQGNGGGSQQEGQTAISRGQGDDVFPQSEERILLEVGKQCPSNQGKAFGPWKMRHGQLAQVLGHTSLWDAEHQQPWEVLCPGDYEEAHPPRFCDQSFDGSTFVV